MIVIRAIKRFTRTASPKLQAHLKSCLFSLIIPLAIGMLWAIFWGQSRLSHQLPETLSNQKFWLTGKVKQVDSRPNKPPRIQLQINQTNGQASKHIKRVRLNWYETRFVPEPGDQVHVRAKLKSIHGRLNPNSFDYHTWLFAEGIDAVGYVIADPANQRTGKQHTNNQLHPFEKLRQTINSLHNRFSSSTEYRAITKALITGDKNDFSSAQWQVFRQTGTVHLIVISGLHIGLLSWLVFHLVSWLIRLTGSAIPGYRADFWAAIAAALTAFSYAGLAGFTIPGLRAMLMVWALLSGLIFSYPINYRTRFLLALVLVLIIDPLAYYQPGFWLSFGIVALILVYTKTRIDPHETKWLHKIKHAIVLQGIIFLGITPWLALFFKQVSLVAPLANLLTIPYVSFVLVPLDFCISLFALVTQHISALHTLNLGLFQLLENLIGLLISLLTALTTIPFASLHLPAANISLSLLLCIAGFCLLLPSRKLLCPGLLSMLVLVLPQKNALQPGEFKVAVIDVGQSLSVLIKTRHHSLVYDTGSKFNTGQYKTHGLASSLLANDLLDTAILPSLHYYGVEHPDKVIISHDNRDHSGGLAGLVARGLVTDLYAPVSLLSQFFYLIPKKNTCVKGMEWVWDQVQFRVIHPDINTRYKKINNTSCVIHISSPYGSILLTGDIEAYAEKQLIHHALALPIQSQVLVVPHHGSKTSSTPDFIAAVNPDYAVVSAGYKNRFKHPHPQISKRYERQGINLKRTDQDGLIDFTFTSQGIKLSTEKAKQTKYWF